MGYKVRPCLKITKKENYRDDKKIINGQKFGVEVKEKEG
jgi:hypothetical protein